MTFAKTLNLGSSIIGVSIVAMPYCFVKDGVFLSILLILFCACLTRLSCHFLLKSAFLLKRRSFELLVQDVLGATGKFLVEVGLISYTLFLFGTCVAYFILIGDLSPVFAELLDIRYSTSVRTLTILILGIFVALPLSLLKNVDSLTSFSFLSMFLYSCLIVKLMFETTDKLNDINLVQERFEKIVYWDLSGLLTTLPIFSLALSCQSSLFELLLNDNVGTLKKNNRIVRQAVYFCSFIYIVIGFLGYTAFYNPQTHIKTNNQTETVIESNFPIATNILLAFQPSLTTTITRLGFIISLVMSFPLCLFPCRTSVHSLLVGCVRKSANFQLLPNTNNAPVEEMPKQNVMNADNIVTFINSKETLDINPAIKTARQPSISDAEIFSDETSRYLDDAKHDFNYNPPSKIYMSDSQFRLITVSLTATIMLFAIMLPNIEFILGMIGSTVGTTVCFILPAYTFLQLGEYSVTELILARLMLFIGTTMLVFCSWSTISNANFSLYVQN